VVGGFVMRSDADVIFTSGYHYLGFMHKFIEYPTTMQTLEFSDTNTANRGAIEARPINV
jgi:hypothetical protein